MAVPAANSAHVVVMPSAKLSPSKKRFRCCRIFPSHRADRNFRLHRQTSADLTPATQVSDELLSSVGWVHHKVRNPPPNWSRPGDFASTPLINDKPPGDNGVPSNRSSKET